MGRLFIVYYTWPNTAENHSGMAHLVKELKKAYPEKISLVRIPTSINTWGAVFQRLHFRFLSRFLKMRLKQNDKLLFMEYLGNISGNQTGIALRLRQWGLKNTFFGLVHLSGKNLLELYGSLDYIKQGATAVDKLIVFGSKLADFFSELGYKEKVITTFHYVDNHYYVPGKKLNNEKLQVIHMGSIKRNFEQLLAIVKACPDVDFHICQGHKDLGNLFYGIDHVTLHNYLPEPELLQLMQKCDVSLSVMEDTVGSNVITTSTACGLVNVVSDVGSVRDYCNDQNAVVCATTDEFVNTLLFLNKDRSFLGALKSNMEKTIDKISLNAFINWVRDANLV